MAVNHINDPDLEDVICEFELESGIKEARSFGSGHINDTFRLISERYDTPDYLLQRINHSVFKDVDGMMNNIALVITHLQRSITPAIGQVTSDLIKTRTGALYHQDRSGSYWRIFDFKKNTRSYDVVETEEQAYQGARAFGLFLKLLADFDVRKLIDTIPDFHNIAVRLKQLKTAIDRFPGERVTQVADQLKYIFDHADQMCQIENRKINGAIPLRVTHNDTKFNNVLLDENDRGICVIDLDTVMPGVVHYDFGDGIRTSTNAAEEDEKDLSKVWFDFGKYKAFATGYLETTREILVKEEIEWLGLSGALLAYMMGVRFLTDYISHDVYYKTQYLEHNLVRARGQLELVRQILARMGEINRYVKKEARVNS